MTETKRCGSCPDSYVDNAPSTDVDSVSLNLPRMYVAPRYRPGVHPMSNLRGTMPYDTTQRVYPKPIFHPNGDIEFPKVEGVDIPPDDIEGYERTENRWRFRPIWPDCEKRFHSIELKQSGSIQVHTVCQNRDAAMYEKPLTCADCVNCPVRRPHGQSAPAVAPPQPS